MATATRRRPARLNRRWRAPSLGTAGTVTAKTMRTTTTSRRVNEPSVSRCSALTIAFARSRRSPPFVRCIVTNAALAALPPTSYGSGTGLSCHQCKSRRNLHTLVHCKLHFTPPPHPLPSTLTSVSLCVGKGLLEHKQKRCRKKFCENCLRKFYKVRSAFDSLSSCLSCGCDSRLTAALCCAGVFEHDRRQLVLELPGVSQAVCVRCVSGTNLFFPSPQLFFRLFSAKSTSL
jgi:hypothetical protein